MAQTVAQIIEVAKLSQMLAAVDVKDGSLFGKRIAPLTPEILYVERKSLEFMYDLAPSTATLTQVAKYVLSLCRGYNLEAQSISVGSGGTIAPVIGQTGYRFKEIFVTVGTSSDAPTAGTSTFSHADFVLAIDLNYLFINKVPYFSGEDFTFNNVSGTITMVAYTWFTDDVIAVPFNQKI